MTVLEDSVPASWTPTRIFGRRRHPLFYLVAGLGLLLLLFGAPIPEKIHETAKGQITSIIKSRLHYQRPFLKTTTARLAYATFLSHDNDKEDEEIEHDKYLAAVRILVYQILYKNETKTSMDIPIVVLVNPDVSEVKRERLRRDGAIVHEVADIDPGNVITTQGSWKSVMSKLRLWELTQFDKICFMDSDTVLTRSLDLIFLEKETWVKTVSNNPDMKHDDEAPMPAQYAFASMTELAPIHSFPPEGDDWALKAYFNAGFMVLKPSLELFNYYISLLNTTGKFDGHMPEQNLLNYAHRWGGNMPWNLLEVGWNVHHPTLKDVEGGVAALHSHWWAPWHHEMEDYLRAAKEEMDCYFKVRDQLLVQLEIE